MDCLTTTNSFKLNKKKSIGNVIFVVEGNNTEVDLIEHIFNGLLNYSVIEKRRNKKKFREYQSPINQNSKVAVINSSESTINHILDTEGFTKKVINLLYNDYGFEPNKCRIYYIWDIDDKSNKYELTKDLVYNLGNSLDNDFELNGLLLLSYPQIESFIISNFEKSNNLKIKDYKDYIKNKYKITDITLNDLIKLLVQMHK